MKARAGLQRPSGGLGGFLRGGAEDELFDSGAEDVDEDEVGFLDVGGGVGGDDERDVGERGGEAAVAAEEGDG